MANHTLLRFFSLTLVFFFQLLFAGGERPFKVHLEEVLSIGGLNDDTLFMWVGVVAGPDNHLVVTDAMDYSLKVFDEKGRLLKKAGRKGHGPGEFLAPRLIDSSERFLYVSDQNIPGLQVFDQDLNFKNRIQIFVPIADFKVISDESIAISTLFMEKDKKAAIIILNSKGEVVRQVEYGDKDSPYMMDMVDFDLDSQGNFYLAYNFQDRIEKFSPDGKKFWSKRLLNVKEVKREKVGNLELPSEHVYKDIALDSSGQVFVLGGNFSKKPSQDVYVLSSEGELLTTFSLPDSSHSIYVDQKDFIYSRADEGVTLKKFRIKRVS
jgi:hypothetical protein